MDFLEECRKYPTSRQLLEKAGELKVEIEFCTLPKGIGGMIEFKPPKVLITNRYLHDITSIPIFCHEMTHILQGPAGWFTIGELKSNSDLLSRAYLANQLMREAEAYTVEAQSIKEVMKDYPSHDWGYKAQLLNIDIVDYINWAGPCGEAPSVSSYHRRQIGPGLERMKAIDPQYDNLLVC